MPTNIRDIKNFLINKEQTKRALKLKEKEEVKSGLKSLTSIWQKYKIQKVYLYGGFSDLGFHEYSDIDIAIETDMGYEEFLRLFSELNRHFRREVDVRLLSELPFKEEVVKEGILIYERKDTHTKKREIKRSGKIRQSFQEV